MMKAQPESHTPVRAASTVRSALRDPFNLFMLVPFTMLGILCLFELALLGRNPVDVILFVVSGAFVFFYFRAVTNRELEISCSGIHYREAAIRLFFPWEEIEGVKIELWKKQITIWRKGKLRRIHEFGLPRAELQVVRRVLQEEIAARNIPQR
jgi:integrase